jgi:hypothetical protein
LDEFSVENHTVILFKLVTTTYYLLASDNSQGKVQVLKHINYLIAVHKLNSLILVVSMGH